MLPRQLKNSLIQYSQLSQDKILSSFLSLKIPPSSLLYFNRQLQQTLKSSFTQIIQKNNITDLYSLIQILLIARQKGVHIINKTILNIFQWSIQCLCQQNIIKIMQILISKNKCLIKIQPNDINTMHKIINTSLKIIQKRQQNYIIRGKLHILLTNILKIAHPSGLKQLNYNKKYIHRCLTFQQYQLYYKNSPISYEFYHKYWQLYRKISIHPQQDQIFINKFNNFTQKLHNQSTTNTNHNHIANVHMHSSLTITKKQTQQLLKILISLHHFIQNIQKLLKQVIIHFKNHPILYTKTNQNYNYNIQFDITLTLLPSYLLKYQHNQQFRIILMTQVQGYYIQLQQSISQILQKVKEKINGKIIFGDYNKQNNIQKIRQFVQLIQQSMKNIQCTYIGYIQQIIGRQKLQNLRNFMKLFFNNQKKWQKIKLGNKKDILKILLTCNLQNSNIKNHKNNKLCMSQSIKNDQIVIDVNSSQSQLFNQFDCSRKILEIKSQVMNKLCITTQNTQKFLNNNISSIKIKKRPNTTSFAYYYTNANLCLQSFDWQNNTQVFFQNQQEYNIFQWKAMRSLCRENIKGIDIIGEDNQGNKNDGKRRRLKLMAFMEEYQSELRMPQKKVKLNIETQAQDTQK